MPKRLSAGEVYAGRAPGVVPVAVTLDREAADLLRVLAPNKKAHGRLLSRLIYEHNARREVQRKVLDAVGVQGE